MRVGMKNQDVYDLMDRFEKSGIARMKFERRLRYPVRLRWQLPPWLSQRFAARKPLLPKNPKRVFLSRPRWLGPSTLPLRQMRSHM